MNEVLSVVVYNRISYNRFRLARLALKLAYIRFELAVRSQDLVGTRGPDICRCVRATARGPREY